MFGLEYDLDLFNIVAVPDFNMYEQIVDSVTVDNIGHTSIQKKELMLPCLLHFLIVETGQTNWFLLDFQGSHGKQEFECNSTLLHKNKCLC